MTAAPLSQPVPPSSFAEMTAILKHLPPANLEALTALMERRAAAPKDDFVNHCYELAAHLARWREHAGALRHPRLALFAGDQKAAGLIPPFSRGADPVNSLCQSLDADLRVYDVSETVTPFDESAAANAMAYGMMAVEPGVDIISLASLSDIALESSSKKGFPQLLAHGRADLAAITGAIIAARLARIPVVLEGTIAFQAAEILDAQKKGAADHCTYCWPTDCGAGAASSAGTSPNTGLKLPVVLAKEYYSPAGKAAPLALFMMRSASYL